MQHKSTKLFVLTLVILAAALIYLLGVVLVPFLMGGLLAYLTDPLVNQLMRFHISRLMSTIIVFVGVFSVLVTLIVLLVPVIQSQLDVLIDTVPDIIDWCQNTILPWIKETFGVSTETVNVATMKKMLADNITGAGGAADWLVHKVLLSGVKLVEFFVNLILIPVVTFYLLCDWNDIIQGCRKLIPRQSEPTAVKLVRECDSVLGAFFRGQFIVMLALGLMYAFGLSLMGLHIGITIGLVAGILSIVPYLGSIIGVVTASIAAYVQFGSMTAVLGVWLVFIIGHGIEHVFLTPKLVGDRIGLHPVAVIFAILAGGKLFGFLGVLLALPVAAVTMVWIRYWLERYQRSSLYHHA